MSRLARKAAGATATERPPPRPADADAAIRLVVQADDFGLCHAVNRGVERAFLEGILTQATMMVPCAWFAEAADLARRHAIPVGMHSTLTCEWDAMRWRPLTDGASLRRPDGTFHASVAEATAHVVKGEAIRELEAQARAMVARGLTPIYFDTHMGLVSTEAYAHVCERYQRSFILPFVPRFVWLDSFLVLSPRTPSAKRAALLGYLSRIGPGSHFVQTHPAVASPELRGLVDPDSPIAPWAEAYRVSDLALLVDPEVRSIVEARRIQLVTVTELEHAALAGDRALTGAPAATTGLAAAAGGAA